MDPRDIQRVGWDVKYVAKFIRQGRGNLDNAYNIMVRGGVVERTYTRQVSEAITPHWKVLRS